MSPLWRTEKQGHARHPDWQYQGPGPWRPGIWPESLPMGPSQIHAQKIEAWVPLPIGSPPTGGSMMDLNSLWAVNHQVVELGEEEVGQIWQTQTHGEGLLGTSTWDLHQGCLQLPLKRGRLGDLEPEWTMSSVPIGNAAVGICGHKVSDACQDGDAWTWW